MFLNLEVAIFKFRNFLQKMRKILQTFFSEKNFHKSQSISSNVWNIKNWKELGIIELKLRANIIFLKCAFDKFWLVY